jgi:hypothetical protein
MIEFDTLDFNIISNQNVATNSDMITMLYEEEVFISQIEANSFIFVNPGAIDDGRGRVTTNRQNSRKSFNWKSFLFQQAASYIFCVMFPQVCVGIAAAMWVIAAAVAVAVAVYVAARIVVAAVVYVSKVVVHAAQEVIKVAEKVVDYVSDKANEVTDKIADVGGW